MQQTRDFCLASTSPRRRELLERFGLRFAVCDPAVDEAAQPEESPEAHVSRLAALKAEAARDAFAGHVILAGDTVVVQDGRVLGKPADTGEAERMLRSLSGATHRVVSAYAVLDPAPEGGAPLVRTVETRVTFRPLPEAWLGWYSRHGEAQDKAGAYGIQGYGGLMVSRIEGSYNNVVGFPVEHLLWDLLERGWVRL